MPQLFTALELPDGISSALSLKRGGLEGARWIDPPNYHITLRYIGEVDRRTACEVDLVMADVRIKAPLRVTIDGMGVFGSKHPWALWAGVQATDEIRALRDRHERALRCLGLNADERKFVPHVTLARLKGVSAGAVARHIERAGFFAPLAFTVAHFVLLSSQKGGGGPYRPEARYPFAGQHTHLD